MTTLSIPNTFVSGTAIASAAMNANFTAITGVVNGNIDDGNIKSGAAINLSKLAKTSQFLDLMTAGSLTIGSGITGDANPRITMTSDGGLKFGAGTSNAVDMLLKRLDANTLAVRDAGDTTDKGLLLGSLKLRNTNILTLTPAAVGADRAITVKDPGASANLIFSTGTLNANGLLYTDGTNILSGAAGSFSGIISNNAPLFAGGRLTASPNSPIQDIGLGGGGSVLWYLPFSSDVLSVYDGSSTWSHLNIGSGVSLSIGSLSANTNYDIFGYSSGGSLALEAVAWSTNTVRAVSLTQVNGSWQKGTDTSRRFLGTIRTYTGPSLVDDSTARFVYNQYNRVSKRLFNGVGTGAASWLYSTTTWRVAGATVAAVGALDYVYVLNGNPSDSDNAPLFLTLNGAFSSSSGAAAAAIALGIDAVGPQSNANENYVAAANQICQISSNMTYLMGGSTMKGLHYAVASECAVGGANISFYQNAAMGGSNYGIGYIEGRWDC